MKSFEIEMCKKSNFNSGNTVFPVFQLEVCSVFKEVFPVSSADRMVYHCWRHEMFTI